MEISTYLSAIESKKENTQGKQKQNYRHRKHSDGCPMGWELGGLGKKGKRTKKYKSVGIN